MNDWLRRHGIESAKKCICETFVVTEWSGSPRIVAYYSVSTGMVLPTELPKVVSPKMTIPVVSLQRIAVDNAFKGRKIGTKLLLYVLDEIQKMALRVGIYAVVLEPLNETVVSFYEGFGFQVMPGNSEKMFITVKQIRALGIGQPVQARTPVEMPSFTC